MKLYFFISIFFFSLRAFALSCDCEVIAYPPLNGPQNLAPYSLELYELEEFGSYKLKNQLKCRRSCGEAFKKNMSSTKIKEMLLSYSRTLLEKNVIGFNCTGLTTLKYPVRVKAKIGDFKLGNVENFVQVINHEEFCF